jgi:uncharacterized protein (TIGR03067 family)
MTEEIEQLQGTWRVVGLEVEGNKLEEMFFNGSKAVVAGEQFATIAMGANYGGLLALDTTSDPYKVDMIFSTGPHAGSRSLGVYRFEKDAWILCLGMAGRDRPEDFATKPGSGHALETLRREPEPDEPNP